MQRPLLLNGFMATGKSSIGRRVASRTQTRFVDLDELVEQQAGRSIAEIFATDGEAAFRKLEREALLAVLDDSTARVVSLGGGALLDRDLRLQAIDRAVLVTLEASPEVVARRAAGNNKRPLLAGDDGEQRAARLLAQRRLVYAEATARVRSDGGGEASVAERVETLWRRDPLGVAVGDASYAVEVAEGAAPARVAELVGGAPVVILVTDTNVGPLHGDRIERELTASRVVRVTLPAGEEHKHIGTVERIWRAALDAEADRSAVFVGLGGGVVTDITGFAAATWMRGARWVGLPTTLLAMVDASVGGKTGVDLGMAKNGVGAFWQPSGVVCDPLLCATEPARGHVSALAEVVKTALVGDPALFTLLESRADDIARRDPAVVAALVRASVRVKARVVSSDERESGPRAMLNLGHTIGHALESHGAFVRWTHGESVSLGLVAALRLSQRLGRTDGPLVERVTRLCARLGLPTKLERADLEAAAALVGHDKKRAGTDVKFVHCHDLGDVRVEPLPLARLRELMPALAD